MNKFTAAYTENLTDPTGHGAGQLVAGAGVPEASADQFMKVVNGISFEYSANTEQKFVNLIATILHETWDWQFLEETPGSCNGSAYDPFCGRGPFHLTWRDAYIGFENFLRDRGYDLPEGWYSDGAFEALTTDADIMVQSVAYWRTTRSFDPADYLGDFQEFNSSVNRGTPGRVPNGGMGDRCIRLSRVVNSLEIGSTC